MQFMNSLQGMNILDRAVNAPLSRVSAANAALTRNVIGFNGLDQFATFANAIVGSGQGELTLYLKMRPGAGNQYLVDGSDGANRLYWLLQNSNTWDAVSGLVITADNVGGSAHTPEGVYQKYTISGDLTGLVLGTLMSRYSVSEFVKGQLLGFSYKDTATDLTYNMDSGLPYQMPMGAKLGQNLASGVSVITGAVAFEAFDVINGLVLTDWYYAVMEITEVASGSLKINTTVTDSAYYSVPGIYTLVLTGADFASLQAGGGGFTGSAVFSFRKFPAHTLIFQSYSQAQWSQYVQQPNGDWKGKDNLWSSPIAGGTNATLTSTGARFDLDAGEGADYKSNNILDPGEWYDYGFTIANHSAGSVAEGAGGWNIVTLSDGAFTGSVLATITRAGFDRAGSVCHFDINKVSYHHLFKLSDYQRKQHYIEQTEKAIAGYKAKDTKPYLVDYDGLDDTTEFSAIALSGDFDVSIDCVRGDDARTEVMVGESDSTDTIFYFDGPAGHVRVRINAGGYVPLGSTTATSNNRSAITFSRRDGLITGYLDGVPLDSPTINTDPLTISSTGLRQGGLAYLGKLWNLAVIDHTAPLPMGQGGNSVFLPMNKAGDTVANVLGLDNKGNVIAKDGAGLGVELWSYGVTEVNEPDTYQLIAGTSYLATFITSGTTYYAVVTNSTNQSVDFKLGGVTKLAPPGVTPFLITATSNAGDLKLITRGSGNTPVLGSVTASVKQAHGYAEWQGDPAREQFILDKTTGALVGDTETLYLSAELQSQWDATH